MEAVGGPGAESGTPSPRWSLSHNEKNQLGFWPQQQHKRDRRGDRRKRGRVSSGRHKRPGKPGQTREGVGECTFFGACLHGRELRDPPFTFHTKQRTQMEGNGPIAGNNSYGEVKSHF